MATAAAAAAGATAVSAQPHQQRQQPQRSPSYTPSRTGALPSSSSPSSALVMTSPSLSNTEFVFGRESRADSIGTLWSSADVPLILDGPRTSNGGNGDGLGSAYTFVPSNSSRSGSTLFTARGLPSLSSSSQQMPQSMRIGSTSTSSSLAAAAALVSQSEQRQPSPSNRPEEDQMLVCDDGQEFIAVRPAPRPPSSGSRDSRSKSRPTSATRTKSATKSFPDGWIVTQAKDATAVRNVASLQKPGSRPSSASSLSTADVPPTVLSGTPQSLRQSRVPLSEPTKKGRAGRDAGLVPSPQPHQQLRNARATDVPASVSDGSQLTFTSSVKSKLHSTSSNVAEQKTPRMQKRAEGAQPSTVPRRKSPNTHPRSAELYRHAERFFDSSYSMQGVSTMQASSSSSPMDTSVVSRFSDDSYSFQDDAASLLGPTDQLPPQPLSSSSAATRFTAARSYTPSHSSAESSNPPDVEDNGMTDPVKAGLTRVAPHDQQGLDDAFRPHQQGDLVKSSLAVSPMSFAVKGNKSSNLHVPSNPNLAAPNRSPMITMRRPSTTDATMGSPCSPRTRPAHIRHAHTSSDQEFLRQWKEMNGSPANKPSPGFSTFERIVSNDKLAFLHEPVPPSALPSPQKRGALFGLRIRAVSTPKLRQSRGASQDGSSLGRPLSITAPDKDLRPTSANRSQHPPQAPSGRFRSMTANADDLERSHSSGSAVSLQLTDAATSDESKVHQQSQPRSRRPSSSEAWAAATRRFRRPSRASSNTSLGATLTESGSGRPRLSSNASSQMRNGVGAGGSSTDLHHISSNTSLRTTAAGARRSKIGTPTTSSSFNKSKLKGGWASYLAQGLTLHLEQGSRKFTCQMNYSYYDPFGRPESLCQEEYPPTSSHGIASRNASVDGDSASEDQPMGVLEFTPPENGSDANSLQDDGSAAVAATSPIRLTFSASDVGKSANAPAVLKHLTIGDDTRADLLTRQANLSLSECGVHEVSGSERKGAVSWRFTFAVEDASDKEGKCLRPVRFSCSTTLLDPARARKSRVIKMIRKQIGSPVVSHSVVGSPDAEIMDIKGTSASLLPVAAPLEAPISPRSLPRATRAEATAGRVSSGGLQNRHSNMSDGSTTASHLTQAQQAQLVLGLRNGSMASMASSNGGSATWSPASRAGLVPFKVKKATVDALRNAGQFSVSDQGSLPGASALLATSPMAATTISSANSPATSVDGSFSSPAKSARDFGSLASTHGGAIASAVQRQQAQYHNQYQQTQQQSRQGYGPPAPATALGLVTNGQPVEQYARSTIRPAAEEDVDWYEGSTTGQWASSQSRSRARRIRSATTEAAQRSAITTVIRPPTASEEIKQAYLNKSQPQPQSTFSSATHSPQQEVFKAPLDPNQTKVDPTNSSNSHRVKAGIVRRMASATAINIPHRNSSGNPAEHSPIPSAAPPSPLREKRLPTAPTRGPLFAVSSSAARQPEAQFEPPEGRFWM